MNLQNGKHVFFVVPEEKPSVPPAVNASSPSDHQMSLPISPVSIVESPPVEDSDPLTCPILPGRETHIVIQKGKSGLGLSIVGGSDTLLVSQTSLYFLYENI